MRNNKKYKTLLGVTPLGGLFGALRSLTNYLKMNALGMCQIIKNLFYMMFNSWIMLVAKRQVANNLTQESSDQIQLKRLTEN